MGASTLWIRKARKSNPIFFKSRPAWFRFLVPSIADLIFILLLVAMTGGALAPRLLGDASIGWHIRNGDLMISSRTITRTDPFSVTMSGQPWYAWEWLYDLAIAGIHHWLGLNGVVLFTAIIIAATFALTLRLCLRRGADPAVTVALLALSLGASMIHLLARPHVLSWLFTVIWFQLLDSSESDGKNPGRRLWWLPALMLLWVNLHGGFVVGFALLGIYLVSDAFRYFRCRQDEIRHDISLRLRQLGAVTVVSLVASLVNPYGYRLHVHVYQYLSSRWLMNHIDEFLSPDFHGVAQQCFVVILLIAIVALAVGKKPSLVHLLVLLFATYSGLYASRSLPVSSLLITLVVAPVLTQAIARGSSDAGLARAFRTFLSRWQSFGSRMTKHGPESSRARLAPGRCHAGVVAMRGSGKDRQPLLDGLAFRRHPFSRRSDRFHRPAWHSANRFSLPTPGADTSSTASIPKPKFSSMTAMICTEKNS